MARRSFTDEFKDAAVRLVSEERRPLTQAADALGIGESTLRYWVRTQGRDPSGGAGRTQRDLRQRVRELEKDNARLTLERDILKKAAAFFARETP